MSLCTLEINLSAIKNNYLLLQDICKTSLVGAAVKANGYGLGAVQISKALIEENCRHFFVASSEEGVNLRKALASWHESVFRHCEKNYTVIRRSNPVKNSVSQNFFNYFSGLQQCFAPRNDGSSIHATTPKALDNDVNILVLNGVFEHDALELIEYNLTPVLNNLKQIEIWQKFSNLKNRLLPCYLHFNTGINRLGLTHNEIEQLINNRDLLKGLDLQYIISHLAVSEEIDNPYNLEQLNRFKTYLQYFPNVKASLANSGGIFLGQDYHFDLARPGAALYGLNPVIDLSNNLSYKEEFEGDTERRTAAYINVREDSSTGSTYKLPLEGGYSRGLQNPVTLKAPIIHLQNLTLDSHIGYNMTFTTERDSVIATLPLGYADGFSRNFSNQGEVFINGRSVPIVGRISMDLINIDVTDLPPLDIFLGQEAEIIGNYCTPDKIASIIGTIGYEVLTSLGSRYKRIYK
ncbi:alanine racemase [Rickettsia felis str. Pedreira]|uniref:Alanine racemase n=2 Tax=Rickettsia felis TaxID=42862 RepID=ALR_RICFE|nr:alanine racemase [Rickettsia felis]Q4UNC8.1 RecName: Full=Alanine racemase [Rickettsia felis URRWXCal2]AAY60930.1 Alanine racemase [Rickettsia felis URRWXCal2]KJV58077.1 alanine racemase [Rickettsia felis str. Pedreira]MDE8611284.1 alanine racemase [Rickettsia felis]